MRRRDLLKLTSYIGAAAVVPYESLERLAAALNPAGRADGPLLDTMSLATTSYAKGYYVARPADLLGLGCVRVNRLAGLALARARERTHPQDAISIYDQGVAAPIETTQAGGYRQAVALAQPHATAPRGSLSADRSPSRKRPQGVGPSTGASAP